MTKELQIIWERTQLEIERIVRDKKRIILCDDNDYFEDSEILQDFPEFIYLNDGNYDVYKIVEINSDTDENNIICTGVNFTDDMSEYFITLPELTIENLTEVLELIKTKI